MQESWNFSKLQVQQINTNLAENTLQWFYIKLYCIPLQTGQMLHTGRPSADTFLTTQVKMNSHCLAKSLAMSSQFSSLGQPQLVGQQFSNSSACLCFGRPLHWYSFTREIGNTVCFCVINFFKNQKYRKIMRKKLWKKKLPKM